MSGIVAIVHLDGRPVEPALLRAMTAAMAYRGPDAQGTWSSAHVGLGHALLRTVPEDEPGRQPLSLDGQVWLAADARIDGQRELRRKLEARESLDPETASDAHLILRAYHLWGEACVEHLLGDFAFVLWDGRRQRLFCARDHFGVKPLYYGRLQDCLLLSNTLNCLRSHPAVSDRLNDLAIADFLLFGRNQELDTTAFADIRRLPPAHSLHWSPGAPPKVQRYWALPVAGPIRYKRPADYVERFRELLGVAVADRLRTNRVGVLMSGGLDSTSVAATAHRLLAEGPEPAELRAYTLVAGGLLPCEQEGHYAGLVAGKLGIPIHYSAPQGYRLFEGWDQPEFWTPEPLAEPLWALVIDQYGLAAGHGRVVLSGQGGDPALYPSRGYLLDLLKQARLGTLCRDVGLCLRLRGRLPPLYLRSRLQNGRMGPVAGQVAGPVYPPWIDDDLAARLNLAARWQAWLQRANLRAGASAHGRRGGTSSHLRPEAYQNLSASLWPDLFERYYDPGATSVPLEVRHPYFDVRLVAYLLALPPLPWCVDKHLTRAAMCGILPEGVRLRAKATTRYSLLHALLRRDGLDLASQSALGAAGELARYVDGDRLERIVRSVPHLAASEYGLITRPVALARWLQQPAPARFRQN